MRVKGKIYPAKHTPIISKELYDQVQVVRLSWNKKPFKYSDKPFIFRGLIKCAHCGCTITSDLKKGKYVYMYCTKSRGPCEGLRIREEELLKQVKNVFRSFQIPSDVLEALKTHLTESAKSKKVFHEEATVRVRKDYDLMQKKLDALLDMRLEGSITRDEYDKKCTALKERQYELNGELSAHTEADESFNMTLSTLLELASRAYELFESSKVDQKRQLINFTLSNLALKGTTLEYQIRKPFSHFGKTASHSEMRTLSDSNARPTGS
ncbi:MAG: recombinase zinc beta ribbon domain-containing protein [Deltaproteobacteria bacterium]|nr:recombinase zinc beta ribbon domain-containing protein [Deltaproteobacteria bacterium]